MPFTGLGIPYPSAASAPTVQADLQSLATELNRRVVFRCTVATRPTLTASDDGVVIYHTDNDTFAQWTGSAWRPVGLHVCTSSTRPASPLAGQTIFETDTLSFLGYDGTNWNSLGGSSLTDVLMLMGA